MRDESQIKMGTNNRFHVEEACESRAELYHKYLLISFSYRVLHTDLRDVDDEVDQNELYIGIKLYYYVAFFVVCTDLNRPAHVNM